MTEHRLARLIVWLLAVLGWFAIGRPRHTRAGRRHHRRYGHVARSTLIHAVRNIVILRAAELLAPASTNAGSPRPRFCPPGFRRAPIATRGRSLRAWGGVWLRHQLKVRGSMLQQALHLIAALRALPALAGEFARRRRNAFLTSAIIAVRPSAESICTLAHTAAAAADSS